MQQLITVALNGRAFALESAGYERLRAWLEEAARVLATDPDREEILRDLEQAIGEKLARVLSAHRNFVTSAEVDGALAEMGAVQPAGPITTPSGPAASPLRRLYRIPDGAMLAGVCTGLAAYLKIDVVIVRIGFVLLTLLTSGFGLLLYVLMAFLMPRASTPEQLAAARGAPLNAQELVDRAKAKYAEFRARRAPPPAQPTDAAAPPDGRPNPV